MGRIDRNYRFIVSFNLMLIILGVTGVIQPTLSALLHNMSTLGISLRSMTNLLPEKNGAEQRIKTARCGTERCFAPGFIYGLTGAPKIGTIGENVTIGSISNGKLDFLMSTARSGMPWPS